MRMAAEIAGNTSARLAHQSLGRELSPAEADFAKALMAIYADGTSDREALAAELTRRAVAIPSSGETDWTGTGLEAELQALNSDLDAAYLENGIGA